MLLLCALNNLGGQVIFAGVGPLAFSLKVLRCDFYQPTGNCNLCTVAHANNSFSLELQYKAESSIKRRDVLAPREH